eukprot:12884383-Prorocentrum_lima.AAC.1
MLPSGIPVFPRHRWLSSQPVIQNYVVLGIHNIFSRSVPVWLAMLRGGAADQVAIGRKAAVAPQKWELGDSDSEGEEQAVLDPAAAPPFGAATDSAASRWQQWNEQMRGSARNFAAAQPEARLLLSLIALKLSSHFLARVEGVAAASWDISQWGDTIRSRGHRHTSRMEEA